MKHNQDDHKKSIFDRDDAWNRTFFGSPTIGGLVLVAAVVLYLIFK